MNNWKIITRVLVHPIFFVQNRIVLQTTLYSITLALKWFFSMWTRFCMLVTHAKCHIDDNSLYLKKLFERENAKTERVCEREKERSDNRLQAII